jgi:hypothetical protein
MYYIGQEKEQGGHGFGAIECSFVIDKTDNCHELKK